MSRGGPGTGHGSSPRPPLIPGYQYVADIATGGYSIVYRYRQQSPRRDVAVKVLTGDDTGVAPQQRDAEANAMAKLSYHPNIVQVFTADVTPDGRHYIVMQFCPGRGLDEKIKSGPLAVRKVLRVGVHIAGALDAAHRNGLLHRDIKPANILIDEADTPRLTDFGIAGWLGPDQQADAGALSIQWSPAEVVGGGKNQRASDIYSLGATLWNLLTGRPPYWRRDDVWDELAWRIQNTDAPATGRADVPAKLEELLAQMLSRVPTHRPASATLIAARLRDIEATLGGPVLDNAPWHDTDPVRFAPDADQAPRDTHPTIAEQTAPGVWRRVDDAEPTTRAERPPLTSTERTVLRPGPARERERPEPISEKTQVRTVGRPPDPRPDTGDDTARTAGSWWVWALAASVVCAVSVMVIVMAADRSEAPYPQPTSGANQNAVVNELPPGVPTITARRVGDQLRFSWTYEGAEAGDTFLWRVAGSTHTAVAREPSIAVHDKQGTQLCVQVKVVRASGAFGTPDWSPLGCGR